jgi:N-glycosylase/DNA lyase
MNLSLTKLNRAITDLCRYICSIEHPKTSWKSVSEKQLFYEATICIFGSQMLYEGAVALANKVQSKQMLSPDFVRLNLSSYESSLRNALSDRITFFDSSGIERNVYPRFKNRLAFLLAKTAKRLYVDGPPIQDLLNSAANDRAARQILVESVAGFGPKQASLFLRRIGYSSGLAVLDVHILDYLELARGVRTKEHSLSRISSYETVESEFHGVAADFGHSVGCVDLATWVTMRVAKREFSL